MKHFNMIRVASIYCTKVDRSQFNAMSHKQAYNVYMLSEATGYPLWRKTSYLIAIKYIYSAVIAAAA